MGCLFRDCFEGFIPVGADKSPLRWASPVDRVVLSGWAVVPEGSPERAAKKAAPRGPADYLTVEEIEKRGYGGFGGVVRAGVCVLDADTPRSRAILDRLTAPFRCAVVETTKGSHYYFRTPAGLADCPRKAPALGRCGVLFDYIPGPRGYVVLKLNGSSRAVVRDPDKLDELPQFLWPLRKLGSKAAVAHCLQDLAEGARNTALFSFEPLLAADGCSKEEIRECLRTANAEVLPSALPGGELERVVMRDEALDGAARIAETPFRRPPSEGDWFGEKGRFNHDNYARHFMDKWPTVLRDGGIWVWTGSGFERNGPRTPVIRSLVMGEVPNLPDAKHREVLKALEGLLQAGGGEAASPPAELVPFANGWISMLEADPMTGLPPLHPHSPDVPFFHRIPHDWAPCGVGAEEAEVTVMRLFEEWADGDANIAANLREMFGACLYGRSDNGAWPALWILLGEKSNGKSTLLRLLQNMLGRANYSTVAPEALDERFGPCGLVGKLANIIGDANESYIKQGGKLKSIVSGDPMRAEEKGEPAFSFIPFCTLVMACNRPPRFNDPSKALRKRLRIVPMTREFPETGGNEVSAFIDSPEAARATAVVAVKAFAEFMARDFKWTPCPAIDEAVDDYITDTNTIEAFIKTCAEDGYSLEGASLIEAYERYHEQTLEDGLDPYGRKRFKEEIERGCGFKCRRVHSGRYQMRCVNVFMPRKKEER